MSTYLKKSIGAIVMAISLDHTVANAANNSTTAWFETIHIVAYDNPYDVANSAFNWSINDYAAWDVGMSGNESGGSGGTGEYSPARGPCDFLRANKPPNCPNPIPYPSGYAYGRDQYPSGSGIPRLIYWIDFTQGVDPTAREFARRGLAHHTNDLTQPFLSIDTANERLLLSVQTACQLQNIADRNNPLPMNISDMQQRCLNVLGQLQAEAGDPGFHGYFFNWMNREGIHLDDLEIPESIIDWLAPSNSLRIRQSTISADAQCAKWWIDAQANQCTF